MSPTIGRPLSDNPKDTMFRVRLDKGTLAKLEECATALKKSKSEIVRIGIEKVYDGLKK